MNPNNCVCRGLFYIQTSTLDNNLLLYELKNLKSTKENARWIDKFFQSIRERKQMDELLASKSRLTLIDSLIIPFKQHVS